MLAMEQNKNCFYNTLLTCWYMTPLETHNLLHQFFFSLCFQSTTVSTQTKQSPNQRGIFKMCITSTPYFDTASKHYFASINPLVIPIHPLEGLLKELYGKIITVLISGLF